MTKLIELSDAVQKIPDGATVMIGGFLAVGAPLRLISELERQGKKDLTIIVNDTNRAGKGVGKLIAAKAVKKVIASHVGTNSDTQKQLLAGDIEVELVPQGTLAERIRAGGAGIPAFFTKTGVGTIIADGKEVRSFNGEDYVMETGLVADVSLVHAWKADTEGNLVYRKTARNFNPIMATAGKVTVAEVEHIFNAGEIDPDHIHTPGIFVKRIIHAPTGPKHIEQRTTRKRSTAAAATGGEV